MNTAQDTHTEVSKDDLGVRRVSQQEFAKTLYKKMMDKGWTQSDLSRASNVGRDSISNYIRGKTIPSPQNLQKLADALSLDPVDLYPNFSLKASALDMPAVQTRILPSDPKFMYLEVNCKLPTEVALEIQALITKSIK